MKTLYDLLGALPDDDAETLRSAFRKAVKASHPDSTSDPEAQLKFRQIVRANDILSDAEQRATYDRLLALARRQHGAKSKRTIGKFASDALAVAFLSAVSIGGYIVFEQLSKAPAVSAQPVQAAAGGRAEIAAVTPTAQVTASALAELRDRLERAASADSATAPNPIIPAPTTGRAEADASASVGASASASANPPSDLAAAVEKSDARDEPRDKLESLGIADAAVAPSAAAPLATAGSAQADASTAPAPDLPAAAAKSDARDEPRDKPEAAEVADAPAAPGPVAPPAKMDIGPAVAGAAPAADLTVKDAKSYRERGMFAYRDGDLYGAIADFDRAIQHDPHFADAYIDRGIVFYRLHEFDRAFADIAQARRIENANRAKMAPTPPRKDERSSRSSRSREVRS
jgi:curved DNA-binding protein CbpA